MEMGYEDNTELVNLGVVSIKQAWGPHQLVGGAELRVLQWHIEMSEEDSRRIL